MYLGSDRASKGVSEVSAVVGAGPKAFVARGQRSVPAAARTLRVRPSLTGPRLLDRNQSRSVSSTMTRDHVLCGVLTRIDRCSEQVTCVESILSLFSRNRGLPCSSARPRLASTPSLAST